MTEAQVSSETTRRTRLVVTIRILYADGEISYIDVKGTASAQAAIVTAWQQAEFDRPDIPISSADVSTANEQADEPQEGETA